MPKKNHPENKNKHLAPELKRSLGVIFLLILAGLFILSYFNLAGEAGNFLNSSLALLFGQTRLLIPVLILIIALLTELQREYKSNIRHILGFIFILSGVNGLLHLSHPFNQALNLARQGAGGGLLGFIVIYPLVSFLGSWAALIILSGFSLAGLLLIFNTTLASLLKKQKNIFLKLGTSGKIIIGVISLFVKKTPRVMNYEKYDEPDSLYAPNFQSQSLKGEKETKDNSPETKEKGAAARNERPEIGTALLEPVSPLKKTNRRLPPLDLLTTVKSLPSAGDIKANLYTIQKTLQNFNIPVEMGEIKVGPTVTQYTLKPADGIKLSRIVSLHDDLALALAAHPIRIEAPIPGRSLVGLEVPNQKVALVTLRELLETANFQNGKGMLKIALGKDVSGLPWFSDLTSLPHLLVAGATNSGKTIYLNALILSLLFFHTSETLRFIFVDPKRVELPLYNGIPHLLTPVITDVQKTVNALRWLIGEMERRFELLSKSYRRNIKEYNSVMEEKMPYIVFVVDELADLMVAAGGEIEGSIVRLAQMARAVGIHLVLSTQRPSVDIITGLIKANFPARMAFSVASLMDSRTILDCGGAEKLLGRGDMLWSGPDMSKPKRLQGAYVSETEIKKVAEFLKEEETPQYNEEITEKQQGSLIFDDAISQNNEGDELLPEAKETINQAGKASASLLQRRLKVGYARAARLLDLLEEQGFIGPADGAKPREVLIKTRGEIIIEKTDSDSADTENPENDDA